MAGYRFLDFELSETDFCLSRAGQRLALEPKALRVLLFLVSRAGRLVDKRELLESVWPDTFVEENTLTRTIASLRRELGDSSRDSKLIETVPTRGYRFIAAVEVLPDPASTPLQAQPNGVGRLATVPDPQTDAASNIVNRSGNLSLRWLLLAACLILAALAGRWLLQRQLATNLAIRSVAVLPLEDLSPGPREEYFADGTTDELITELARIPNLRIVSRTSAMQLKGTKKTLQEIAKELNVEAVVEGSVVRSGDHVRITAQLIDTRSDRHVWAQSFEGPLGDVLTIQDSVAREIAAATRTALTPVAQTRLASGKHINPAAHDDYLRGLYFIQRRDGVAAASHFREAIALEPEYAEAQAGLAEALVTQFMAAAEPSAVIPPATVAAKRAIELDPACGQAYTALGAIEGTYSWEWDAAEQHLRKGVALNPTDSNAKVWLAMYLLHVDRTAEAVDVTQRALASDPLSFWANRDLGAMLYFARRYDESLGALRRAAEIAPDKLSFVEGWNSALYEEKGRYEDAVAADIKSYPALSPADRDSLRSAFRRAGWKGYQEAVIRNFLPRAGLSCHYWGPIARSYVRLGNLTEAFHWYQRAVDEHCGDVVFLMVDPRLDHIRSDPRYTALLHRMNLPH